MGLNLALTDTCMLALAKSGELLQDQASVKKVLKRWHTKADYAEEMLESLKKPSSNSEYPDLPSNFI